MGFISISLILIMWKEPRKCTFQYFCYFFHKYLDKEWKLIFGQTVQGKAVHNLNYPFPPKSHAFLLELNISYSWQLPCLFQPILSLNFLHDWVHLQTRKNKSFLSNRCVVYGITQKINVFIMGPWLIQGHASNGLP